MLARKPHNHTAEEYSREWIDQVSKTLHSVYSSICRRDDRSFKVYGYTYDDEALLIICLVKENDNFTSSLSFFISVDKEAAQKEKELFKRLLGFSGVLMDETFEKLSSSDESEEIYFVNWQEYEYNTQKYYFKITRENIELSIAADRLLNQ